MDGGGSFACPECGNEVALKGTTAGRQVRCGWCETWIEIPFLPRAIVPRARFSRGRRPRWVAWTWGGVAVVSILIVALGASRMIRTWGRHQAERNLTALVATAKAEESAGRFDEAVEAIKAALKEASRLGHSQPERQGELQRLRDRLVRRAAEARIEAAVGAPPAEAIATYEMLLSRTWRDGALDGLEGMLRDRLERTRHQWAETDVAAAKRNTAAGLPNEAIDLCERAIKTAEELAPAARTRIQADANAIVTALIEKRGVIFDQPVGQFALGTPQTYQTMMEQILGPVLRQHGYVPGRPTSSWKAVWEARAPYHVAAEVAERQQGTYLNSGNRLSVLSLQIRLNRGGASTWQAGPLLAQTQPAIPSLSAFTASRLAIDERRRVEFERLLYDDAWTTLVGKVQSSVRRFPDFRAPGN